MNELKDDEIIVGDPYLYRDGRIVYVVQKIPKLKRVEVIVGETNPWFTNYSNLKPIKI